MLGKVAQKCFTKVLAQSPTDGPTLANYGFLADVILHDLRLAQLLYCRSIASNPRHVRSVYYYAQFVSMHIKDTALTEVLYKQALDVNPCHCNALKDYAHFVRRTYRDLRRFEDMLREVLRMEPTHKRALTDLGSHYCEHNRREEGLALLRRCADCYPDDKYSHSQLLGALFASPHPSLTDDVTRDILHYGQQLADYCVKEVRQWYRNGVVVASQRSVRSLNASVTTLLKVVDTAVACNEAEIATQVWSTIVLASRKVEHLKQASSYFRAQRLFDLELGALQRTLDCFGPEDSASVVEAKLLQIQTLVELGQYEAVLTRVVEVCSVRTCQSDCVHLVVVTRELFRSAVGKRIRCL
jgi:tetratricopeptide (TPR) repeat protein